MPGPHSVVAIDFILLTSSLARLDIRGGALARPARPVPRITACLRWRLRRSTLATGAANISHAMHWRRRAAATWRAAGATVFFGSRRGAGLVLQEAVHQISAWRVADRPAQGGSCMKPVARVLIVPAWWSACGLASAGPHYYHQPPPPPHHHHHHHRGPHLGKMGLGLAVAVPLIAIASHANRAPELVLTSHPRRRPCRCRWCSRCMRQPARRRWSTRAMASPISRWNLTSANATSGPPPSRPRWRTPRSLQRAVEACMDGRGYTFALRRLARAHPLRP